MITLYVKINEEEFCATFQDLTPPREVQQLYFEWKGRETLYDITGWSASYPGTTPALARLVTDSGDGQAILIYGGDMGIVMKPADLKEFWNPASPNQETRPYLVTYQHIKIIYTSSDSTQENAGDYRV